MPVAQMPLLCLKRDWHSVVVNIFFFDSRTQTLWSPHSAGDDSPYLKDLKFPMGIGQVGSVASNREPQIREHKEVGDVDQADDALLPSSTDRAWTSATTTLAHKFWARHSLCVPMLTQVRARTPHPIALHLVAECGHWIGQTGRLVGVLQAINKVHFSGESHADDGFDQFDLTMMTSFSEQAATVMKRMHQNAIQTHLCHDDSALHDLLDELSTLNVTDRSLKRQGVDAARAAMQVLDKSEGSNASAAQISEISFQTKFKDIQLPPLRDLRQWVRCFGMHQCTRLYLVSCG